MLYKPRLSKAKACRRYLRQIYDITYDKPKNSMKAVRIFSKIRYWTACGEKAPRACENMPLRYRRFGRFAAKKRGLLPSHA